jgi:hypothetical protein
VPARHALLLFRIELPLRLIAETPGPYYAGRAAACGDPAPRRRLKLLLRTTLRHSDPRNGPAVTEK